MCFMPTTGTWKKTWLHSIPTKAMGCKMPITTQSVPTCISQDFIRTENQSRMLQTNCFCAKQKKRVDRVMKNERDLIITPLLQNISSYIHKHNESMAKYHKNFARENPNKAKFPLVDPKNFFDLVFYEQSDT